MRRSRPRRAAEVLQPVARDSAPRTPLGAVQAAWPQAVGEPIANAATPKSLSDQELTVACDSASWAQELDLLQPRLLAALAALLPRGEAPLRIRFVCESPSDGLG